MTNASMLSATSRNATPGNQGGLARALVRTLLVFTFIPLFLMGGGAYLRAQALLRDQVIGQMQAQIKDQASQIELTATTKGVRLDRLARSPDFISAASAALAASPPGSDFAAVQADFERVVHSLSPEGGKATFSQYFLMAPNGTIAVGTVPAWTGLSLTALPIYSSLTQADRQSFVAYDASPLYGNQLVLMTISQIRRPDGTHLGTLVGVTESRELQAILQNLATPSSGAEAVFVTQDNAIIGTDPYTGELVRVDAPAAESATFKAALDKMMPSETIAPTTVQFTNQQGARAFGQAVWLSGLHTGIVYDVAEARVFGALGSLVPFTIAILVAALVAMAVVLSIGAQRVFSPLRQLAENAQRLAAGDFTQRAEIRSNDEIGQLAGSFNSMANQLRTTIAGLEQRVAERTQELEAQTLRLRTAAEVARDATVAPSLSELLDRGSKLIFDRFGLTEAGIYLLDESKQYAVLRSAPSEAGQKMLKDGYRVAVGDKGVVSQVASTGEGHLAQAGPETPLGIGDPYHTNTRSQLALPLKTNEGLIGVLDLQSNRSDAFSAADTAMMQVLADQMATAMERSRLLRQVQDRLGQLEQTYLEITEKAWGAFGRKGREVAGYKYDNVRLDPLTVIPEGAATALVEGRTLIKKAPGSEVEQAQSASIPIKLRGRVLGVVHVNLRGGATERTVALIEQAADRLGTALENVRLLDDSLRRANKERTIGEISAKISSSINLRNVLQTAVEELGRAIPGSDVSIRLRREHADSGEEVPA